MHKGDKSVEFAHAWIVSDNIFSDICCFFSSHGAKSVKLHEAGWYSDQHAYTGHTSDGALHHQGSDVASFKSIYETISPLQADTHMKTVLPVADVQAREISHLTPEHPLDCAGG